MKLYKWVVVEEQETMYGKAGIAGYNCKRERW